MKTLSFLKKKGFKWNNGENLEKKLYIKRYWEAYKSQIYLCEISGDVTYGNSMDLDFDTELLKELKENEKIEITEENLNKLYLIAGLK